MHERPAAEILLVERDPIVAFEIMAYFSRHGLRAEWVDDAEKAFNCLDTRTFDVLVTELDVQRGDGMRLMRVARERNPDVCVILIADESGVERATEAMRDGAYDFQTKPLNMGKLEAVIQRGLVFQRLMVEQFELKRRLDERFGLDKLIGRSRSIINAYSALRRAAPTRVPVIISGEAGTGKDLVAQALHNNSARRDEPFVKLECRGGSGAVLEAELFGRGAGAGRMQLADKGTLYLDEAEAMPPALHGRVLQAIEEGRIARASDGKFVSVDVRLVVSLTGAPGESIQQFVLGLRERFDAAEILLPPLRDRREDIPLLAEAFLGEASRAHRKSLAGLTRNAMDMLVRYAWPGNVGELRRTIDALAQVARGGQAVDVGDLPPELRHRTAGDPGEIRIPAGATMAEIERIAIEETLRACGYNKPECARRLGIGLRTLYRKLGEYETS